MLGLLFWAFFFKSGFEVGGRLDRLMAGGWRHPEMSDIGTFLKYRLPDFPKRLRPRHADWTSILYSRYRFRVYRVRRSGPWPPQISQDVSRDCACCSWVGVQGLFGVRLLSSMLSSAFNSNRSHLF